MVTARTMIEHALRFAPALESLVGSAIDWEPHLSERFHCGIHRDSSLTMAEHVAHFNTLERIYQEAAADRRLHYLGRRPSASGARMPRSASPAPVWFTRCARRRRRCIRDGCDT